MTFGRTDLRIGVSGAKFDSESDFEVRFVVGPPKPSENSEKQKTCPEILPTNIFCMSKNEMLVVILSVNREGGG